MDSVRDGSIGIADLQHTFGALSTDGECVAELKYLATTGSGEITSADEPWIEVSSSNLKDFLLLLRMRRWLPSLLRLRELVQSLLRSTQEKDSFYQQLHHLLDVHNRQWEKQTLRTVSDMVNPVKVELTHGFSTIQLNFLSTLAESPDLMKWLLEHSSTNEFNRLLQVCRPNTDEPRILSAIASLVQIRTLLLQPLYAKPPFDG